MNTQYKLTTAAEGLLMMSEADHPFDYLETQETQHNNDVALKLSGREPGTPVAQTTLDRLLRNMTDPASGSVSQATAARFVQLANTLKDELTDIGVYRVGEIQIDVLILGKTQNRNIAGMKTRLIET